MQALKIVVFSHIDGLWKSAPLHLQYGQCNDLFNRWSVKSSHRFLVSGRRTPFRLWSLGDVQPYIGSHWKKGLRTLEFIGRRASLHLWLLEEGSPYIGGHWNKGLLIMMVTGTRVTLCWWSLGQEPPYNNVHWDKGLLTLVVIERSASLC